MYDKELLFAKELAKKAGAMIVTNFSLTTQAAWKANNSPITKTDTAINRLVIQTIQQSFPADGILGEEESYETGRKRLWVTDPIDGTIPFMLGAPLSTFCLSLVIEGQPIIGIIYDPFLKRLFWATKGQGAHMNNQYIHVSDSKSLAQNFVTLGSSRMAEGQRKISELYDEIEKRKGKYLNFRSFAYGSVFVGCGRAVATILHSPYAWDSAATKLIIEEAGGKVTDTFGGERRYDQEGNGLVATNGHVHEQILKLINP